MCPSTRRRSIALILMSSVLTALGIYLSPNRKPNTSNSASFNHSAPISTHSEGSTSSTKPETFIELRERRAVTQPASDIFVVSGLVGLETGFKSLIELMGEHGIAFYNSSILRLSQGPNGLIAQDDVVILKINSQWDERGGTNTDLIKEVINMVVSHPDGFVGEVVVADNGQAQYGSTGHGGSLTYERNNAEDHKQSCQRVVDSFSTSFKVSTWLWDNITSNKVDEYSEGDMEDGYVLDSEINPNTKIRVSYPKFKTKYGTYISFRKGIWHNDLKSYSNNLKVINIPVLKTHSSYGVTACVKHYMGVASDKLTSRNEGRAHSSIGYGGMGTQMVQSRMPTLNVLDALWVNAIPRNGPSSSYEDATRRGVVAVCRDPVALDYWASKYILKQVAERLGFKDVSSIDPDVVDSGFGKWLRLSMHEIERAGYVTTCDEGRVNVHIKTK
ncbi:MAG: DUF362 domain-containing protein [Nitrososphaeria archaeon]